MNRNPVSFILLYLRIIGMCRCDCILDCVLAKIIWSEWHCTYAVLISVYSSSNTVARGAMYFQKYHCLHSSNFFRVTTATYKINPNDTLKNASFGFIFELLSVPFHYYFFLCKWFQGFSVVLIQIFICREGQNQIV